MKTSALLILVALMVAALAAAAGCSEDEPPAGTTSPGSHEPCKLEPWKCPEGETCWLDYEGAQFVCQTAGLGASGDECVNTLGQPTCAEGLACYQLKGSSRGVCSPFCDTVDPHRRCPDGATCRPLLYDLPGGTTVIHLCEPPGWGGGGGGAGGSGAAGGSGGSGGSD